MRAIPVLAGPLRAAEEVCEAARRLLADPMYHDCRGPGCLLCGGLADAYDAWRATKEEPC